MSVIMIPDRGIILSLLERIRPQILKVIINNTGLEIYNIENVRNSILPWEIYLVSNVISRCKDLKWAISPRLII